MSETKTVLGVGAKGCPAHPALTSAELKDHDCAPKPVAPAPRPVAPKSAGADN
jgi:hypothetical protein